MPTEQGDRNIVMLLMFTEQDGKWVADFLDANPRFSKEEPVLDLTVKDELVKLAIKLGGTTLGFEGKVQAGRRRSRGRSTWAGTSSWWTLCHRNSRA